MTALSQLRAQLRDLARGLHDPRARHDRLSVRGVEVTNGEVCPPCAIVADGLRELWRTIPIEERPVCDWCEVQGRCAAGEVVWFDADGRKSYPCSCWCHTA